MKIDRIGLHLFGITYHWPILQTFFFQKRFIDKHGKETNSLLQCLRSLQTAGEALARSKVVGRKIEDVLKSYGKQYFVDSCGILLYDVDVSAKPATFWSHVPPKYIKEFLKDVVLIECSSKDEVKRLFLSLPSEFCSGLGFANGELIIDRQPNQ